MDEFDGLIARLRAMGTSPVDPSVASEHLTAMAAAGRRRAAGRKRSRFVHARVLAAFAAGLVLGGTGLASAGVLGGTVQDKVADAAAHAGVNLPGGTTRSTNGCPTGQATPKNHGQFVRQGGNPSADCGKPTKAGDKGNPDANDNGQSRATACRPPWAGAMDKSTRTSIKDANPNWQPPSGCDNSSESPSTEEHGKPETTPTVGGSSGVTVTPPGGGPNDNAGVPSGGSVPSSQSTAGDHRPEEVPPSTVPSAEQDHRGGTTTTTTPAP